MKIYLDLLLILNFIIDFIILLSVGIILRRNYNSKRIILGSFVGSFSIILVFLNISNFLLIILKLIIGIIINIISFKFINIKYTIKNVLYFYTNSLLLGGVIYSLTYKFPIIHNSFALNMIFLIFLSPIIIYIYIFEIKKIKYEYSNYLKIYIIKDGKKYKYTGYIDTGNTLIDSLTGKKVILIDKRKLLFRVNAFRFISYNGVKSGLLKVIKIDSIVINEKEIKNVVLGLIDKIDIDGVDVILNRYLLEG